MKKISIILILLAFINISAQVGVNTETPTNTLDVNGTTRVRILPKDGDSFVYDNTNKTFNSERIASVNEEGVLGSIPKSFLAFNITSAPVVTNTTYIHGNGVATTTNVSTQTITLDAPALVTIHVSLPFEDVFLANGQLINDGQPRLLRANLVVNNKRIAAQSQVFTRDSNSPNLAGTFYNSLSAIVKLDAGTHTIKLDGTCFFNARCNIGGNQGFLFSAKVDYL